ncbi:6-hydroxymethylpterin diphosphokinase MptE-like protein [Glaciecola sp. 1036]|uniref:motility associated factor glycosyltransferase family protein n=1 Tax=Alteromonadaceae TaxID=72275 RepID=UPI003CFD23D4
MLNYIRQHLHENETVQAEIEQQKSLFIQQRFAANLAAFEQYLPNIGNFLKHFVPQTTSVFTNANGELNVVNFSTGKVLYPFHVDTEIQNQTKHWPLSSVLVDIDPSSERIFPSVKLVGQDNIFQQTCAYTEQLEMYAKTADTLVVLGLGKGLHLLDLYQKLRPKYFIIYEENPHFIHTSALAFDWAAFLELLAKDGTALFFQTQSSGQTLTQDLVELANHTQANKAVVFQHLHNATSDEILRSLRNPEMKDNSRDAYLSEPGVWRSAINIQDWEVLETPPEKLTNNLSSLEYYFNDIYQVFKNYKSQYWMPIVHKTSGQISLFNAIHLCAYTPNPEQDAVASTEQFANYPNKESLVMGYAGNKLTHFAFNQFYTQIGAVISGQTEQRAALPPSIGVLIAFGLGNGYVAEALYNLRENEHFFINEPNPDFFYWSLLVSDWQQIFKHKDQGDGHVYLNIGELGASLISEYSYQLALIGNHQVAQSFIFQGYAAQNIDLKLTELRNTFTSLFGISDNFDHSFYGIQHFLHSVETSVPYMTKDVTGLSKKLRQQPVFIVGNGPSLDYSIEQIKACQDTAIIISCGTAIKSLYTHGICPDFHAEIELYRANYDWITQIDDADYLKQITLISVDGIHPDNTQLFKDVLLALKNGEASSSVVKFLRPENDFVSLSAAYPTVSNFVLSFFAHAGFTDIYLFGVDLGFKDPNAHHSKNSAYYQQGKDVYKVSGQGKDLLQVPGNFSQSVFTKFEFKMSKTMLEQVLGDFSLDCYNTSDGAKVQGSYPLPIEDIFVLATPEEKVKSLEAFRACFTPIEASFKQDFESVFATEDLVALLQELAERTPKNLQAVEEIEALLSAYQTKSILESFNTMYFNVLFSSTVSCFMAALIKVKTLPEESAIANANQILTAWHQFLIKVISLLKLPSPVWDISVAFAELREKKYLQAPKLPLLSFEPKLTQLIKQDCGQIQLLERDDTKDLDKCALYLDSQAQFTEFKVAYKHWDKSDCLFVTSNIEIAKEVAKASNTISVMLVDYANWLACENLISDFNQGQISLPLIQDLTHNLQARFEQRHEFGVFVQKPRFKLNQFFQISLSDPQHPANHKSVVSLLELLQQQSQVFAFKHYIAIPKQKIQSGTILDKFGSRGIWLNRPIFATDVLDYGYFATNINQIEQCLEEFAKGV